MIATAAMPSRMRYQVPYSASASRKPEIDQHADERPLERADAADHHHEDDDDGPVVDAEARLGRDAQLLQEDEGADEAGAGGGHDIDHELRAERVDAEAFRRGLGIADRGEREAVARAQQKIDIAATTIAAMASASQ